MDRHTSILVALILVIVAAGLYLLDSFGLGRRLTVFCAIAAALVTFFGSFPERGDTPPTTSTVR